MGMVMIVEVITADALRLPLPRRPFRAVASLPFGSTAALLRWLLDDPRTPLRRADLDAHQWAAILGFLPDGWSPGW
jgi:16S rRNA A1518/A1519 N6-dimethyltransferase RsmA/KsgA/DIM1 with predicted DNA glycosylase/AP lyase activity